MAFDHTEVKKGLSLPGLIDIIFLLLVFSLVTLSFSQAEVEAKKRGERPVAFKLPETKYRETVEAPEVLQTLLLQVEHEHPEDETSRKMVYVLRPSVRDSLTVAEARTYAIQDSLFAAFPSDFLELDDSEFAGTPACTLIQWAVRTYKKEHLFQPDLTNAVEIRAVRDTEFRIVNFIMESCSVYGDTIPRFTLRTLTGGEEERGL